MAKFDYRLEEPVPPIVRRFDIFDPKTGNSEPHTFRSLEYPEVLLASEDAQALIATYLPAGPNRPAKAQWLPIKGKVPILSEKLFWDATRVLHQYIPDEGDTGYDIEDLIGLAHANSIVFIQLIAKCDEIQEEYEGLAKKKLSKTSNPSEGTPLVETSNEPNSAS